MMPGARHLLHLLLEGMVVLRGLGVFISAWRKYLSKRPSITTKHSAFERVEGVDDPYHPEIFQDWVTPVTQVIHLECLVGSRWDDIGVVG